MNITLKLKVVAEGYGKTKLEALNKALAQTGLNEPLMLRDKEGNTYISSLPEGGMYAYHAEKQRNALWVKSGSGWHVRLYKLPHEHIATVKQHARYFTFTTK